MELVDGDTLADLIERGPVPVPSALVIARQIAEALDHAHEHGVLHRDLKPANIKVTPDGQVKVLDFGLAKAMEPSHAAKSSAQTAAPALTSPAVTQAGMLLGTAAYMSPEQARGAALDRRADIWAFGCVLYEMLTGRRAFEGETVSDVLAAVLTRDLDLRLLPAETPAGVRVLIERCLARDLRERLRDIGDARHLLAPGAEFRAVAVPVTTSRHSLMSGLAWTGWIAAAGLGAWALWSRIDRPAHVERPAVVSVEIAMPGTSDPMALFAQSPAVAVSPDGRSVVLADTSGRLFVRRLASPSAATFANHACRLTAADWSSRPTDHGAISGHSICSVRYSQCWRPHRKKRNHPSGFLTAGGWRFREWRMASRRSWRLGSTRQARSA